MNSPVSKLGSNSKNTTRVKLQEYITMYAFCSFYDFRCRYFTGPVMSTPMTLKGLFPSVLSLSRGLAGG